MPTVPPPPRPRETSASEAAAEEPIRRATAAADSARDERRALGVAAMIALGAIVWIAQPVGIGVLLGTLLAFSLQPFYEKSVEKHGRPGLMAIGYVLISTAGLVVTMGGISSLLIARGVVMAQTVIAIAPGIAQRTAARLGPVLVLLHFNTNDIAAKLRDAAADLASRAAAITAAVATTTFDILLTLFFAMMTLSFILRRWREMALRAEEMLPLRPRYTRALLEEFQRVGRTTLLGTVLTGLAQGALAAVGYWITGVPEPAFFGAATALASLLPGVGTLFIWVPAGIFLLAEGHLGMGVLELIWGTIAVVGASDYVIRPRLVGGHGTMPALLTFIALFGGVEVFGLAGLILGPLIVSLSFAVLRIFAQDAEERRASGERHA